MKWKFEGLVAKYLNMRGCDIWVIGSNLGQTKTPVFLVCAKYFSMSLETKTFGGSIHISAPYSFKTSCQKK
jgi:hypothetical protein